MLERIVAALAALGLLLFALLVVTAVALIVLRRRRVPRVRRGTVLELDLDEALTDEGRRAGTRWFGRGRRPPGIGGLVERLDRAASDRRIIGLAAQVNQPRLGLADAQELREAIARFGASGKPTLIHATSFGEGGTGNLAYYLASSFKRILLQPTGTVGLVGLAADAPFARSLLDRIGIRARMDHRKEYKSALNHLTEKGFTAPHRESVERILESQWSQMVEGVARTRRKPADEIRALAARAPLEGADALKGGLVDALAYRDAFADEVKKVTGKKERTMDLATYAPKRRRRGTVVAYVRCVGAIRRGKSAPSPWGGPSAGSETLVSALREAIEDKRVKAILLRVNSPGGSAVASDAIWREVARAREKGKPVVAWMGDVAASGGYFVAMAADRIIASPGTITGSIGVVAGKLLTRDAWARAGINWEMASSGGRAGMDSSTRDYTDDEWRDFQKSLDRIYDDFVEKAAKGRAMPREKMEALARGRVWTGADAHERGLVDGLGGYPEAMAEIRKLAKIPGSREVRFRAFPAPTSPLRELLFGPRTFEALLESAPPGLTRVAELFTDELLRDPAMLLMPGWERWMSNRLT